MIAVNFFPAVLTCNKVRNLVDRPRTVQGVHSDQVKNSRRFQFAQVLLHTRRFKLEHRSRHTLAEQVESLLVIERNVAHVEVNPAILLDHVHRVLNDGQVDEAKEVHLQKSDIFGVVLVVHHHGGIGRGRPVKRGKVVNRSRRNHHTAGMHARLAGQILERKRNIPKVLVTGATLYHGLQRFRTVAIFEVVPLLVLARPCLREAKVQRSLREQLGNHLRFLWRQPKYARNVSNHRLRLEHTVGNDLPHAIVAVLVGHILNNAPAVPIRNIGIDIGHAHAFGVQEAFKKEVKLKRVDVGNADDVGNQRTCGRTTARTHGNTMFTRPVNKVPHNKQVARHVHVADTVQFLVHALCDFGFVRRELEIFVGETPLETFVTKVRDVNVGIATRFAPAVRILFPSLVVVFGKGFLRSLVLEFSLFLIGQGFFVDPLLGAISGNQLLRLILNYTLPFTFTNDRILCIVFGLHVFLDLLVFFRSKEFIGNLETGPKLITNARLDRKVAAFRNLYRILDSPRDMPEEFDHFFFGSEIELVCRETRIRKVIQRALERNAAQHLVRRSIFGLNIVHIGNGHNLAAHLLRQFHIEFIYAALLLDSVIAHRKIQVFAVKNLVEVVHELACLGLTTRRHVLSITAKVIARNGNNAILVLAYHIQRNRGDFGPAVAFLIAVTHNTEQVVIARLVFDKQGEPLIRNRVLHGGARGIHIHMTAVNRLYRRKALLLAGLVHVLSARLDFKNAEHGAVVCKGYGGRIFGCSRCQNAIKASRRL